jgi:hypothetical protein
MKMRPQARSLQTHHPSQKLLLEPHLLYCQPYLAPHEAHRPKRLKKVIYVLFKAARDPAFDF